MGTHVGCISCISHEVFHGVHVANLQDRGESKTIKKLHRLHKWNGQKRNECIWI